LVFVVTEFGEVPEVSGDLVRNDAINAKEQGETCSQVGNIASRRLVATARDWRGRKHNHWQPAKLYKTMGALERRAGLKASVVLMQCEWGAHDGDESWW